MLEFLETGQALYVLAGICLLGILTRVMTRNLYKRLIKESANMATTKNKSLRELKQRTENTYRINQGLRDCGAWLDHQLCELKFRMGKCVHAVDLAVFAGRRNRSVFFLLVSVRYGLCSDVRRRGSAHGYADHAV